MEHRMNEMNQEQFAANAHQISLALTQICESKGMDPADAAQLIGAACAEAMAYFIGHPFAVERLRDIADIAEREVLRAH
jgi:hypothetical protein